MLESNMKVDRQMLERFANDLHDLLARREDVTQTLERVMADPNELPNYDLLSDLRILEHLGRCITGGVERVMSDDLTEVIDAEAKSLVTV